MPTSATARAERQEAILNILQERPIDRQSELVDLLHRRGIVATQSSVSRDLKQLGINKLEDGYRVSLDSTANEEFAIVAGLVREIRRAGANLTVIRTGVGAAQRVAVFLDRSGWSEIIGTVSGDDTIFVATRDNTEQRRLIGRIRRQISR